LGAARSGSGQIDACRWKTSVFPRIPNDLLGRA
jgi:hypothetical protein